MDRVDKTFNYLINVVEPFAWQRLVLETQADRVLCSGVKILWLLLTAGYWYSKNCNNAVYVLALHLVVIFLCQGLFIMARDRIWRKVNFERQGQRQRLVHWLRMTVLLFMVIEMLAFTGIHMIVMFAIVKDTTYILGSATLVFIFGITAKSWLWEYQRSRLYIKRAFGELWTDQKAIEKMKEAMENDDEEIEELLDEEQELDNLGEDIYLTAATRRARCSTVVGNVRGFADKLIFNDMTTVDSSQIYSRPLSASMRMSISSVGAARDTRQTTSAFPGTTEEPATAYQRRRRTSEPEQSSVNPPRDTNQSLSHSQTWLKMSGRKINQSVAGPPPIIKVQ